MIRELEIALPFPPSVNHYWRHTRQGKHYISDKGKRFRELALLACFAELPFDGLVSVEVKVYLPDRRDRDLDNLWKVIMDSLTHAQILKDDSWKCVVKESIEAVGEVRINEKGETEFIPEIVKDGRVVVTIKELKRGG